RRLKWVIGTVGMQKAIMLLVLYVIMNRLEGPDVARTVLFTGFILLEFVRIGVIRAQDKLKWLSNPWLLMALVLSMVLQLVIVYTPMRQYFSIVPLGMLAWGLLLVGAMITYVVTIGSTNLISRHVKSRLDRSGEKA
ncbi:MAG: calcium-translocating P-type ATPase, PMCA-type, partial [Candidatus Uhrbacteria bacterium GW2011_GWC2_53_7]